MSTKLQRIALVARAMIARDDSMYHPEYTVRVQAGRRFRVLNRILATMALDSVAALN